MAKDKPDISATCNQFQSKIFKDKIFVVSQKTLKSVKIFSLKMFRLYGSLVWPDPIVLCRSVIAFSISVPCERGSGRVHSAHPANRFCWALIDRTIDNICALLDWKLLSTAVTNHVSHSITMEDSREVYKSILQDIFDSEELKIDS